MSPGAAPAVPLPGPLVAARFVERPNRFVVRVRLPEDLPAAPGRPPGSHESAGAMVDAHLADPGRLTELLVPDVVVWLRPAGDPARKTRWSAVLVDRPGGEGLVSVDTTLPNRLVGAALEAEWLDELRGWRLAAREWSHGRSRFDFLLRSHRGTTPDHDLPIRDRPEPDHLVLEVKSVTLVEDGVALFPDALTARGARHVRELAEIAARDGWEGAVLFVLQRPDADRIVAARSIDPDFADALEGARRAGVRLLGRRCRVEPDRVTLGARVDVAPG